MSLKEMEAKLRNLKPETKELYNKLTAKYDSYRITVNGLGIINLVDLRTMKILAVYENECQAKMVELLNR